MSLFKSKESFDGNKFSISKIEILQTPELVSLYERARRGDTGEYRVPYLCAESIPEFIHMVDLNIGLERGNIWKIEAIYRDNNGGAYVIDIHHEFQKELCDQLNKNFTLWAERKQQEEEEIDKIRALKVKALTELREQLPGLSKDVIEHLVGW